MESQFFINTKFNKIIYLPFILITLIYLSSCEDFVEVDAPETALAGESVFDDDVNANAAVVGLYSDLVGSPVGVFTFSENIFLLSGLSSDELNTFSDEEEVQFQENEIIPENPNLRFHWNEFYSTIYACNSIIDGVSASTGITDSLATQYEGEARFVRSWMYFHLVNLYGGVPLAITSDFELNVKLPRSTVTEVYDQIVEDLEFAREFLSEEYISVERIRPNQAVATALLARVRLYQEEWNQAELLSTAVIDDGRYALEPDLNGVFTPTSNEAIWQLQSIVQSVGTYEALNFVLTFPPSFTGQSELSEDLLNAFEPGDNRDSLWVATISRFGQTAQYPFKYQQRQKSVDEAPVQYSTPFRLAEMYLIRAEARAQLGNIVGAQEDLNAIRNRAGLSNTVASNQANILLAIEQERRVELFMEYCHRWFDLNRTNRATEVLGPLKAGWQDTDALWPIPAREFQTNPNLGDQNPGY